MVATVEKEANSSGETKEREASLKVGVSVSELISKIAHLRGKSIAKLFKDEDVENFFAHLYTEELRKETEKMRKKRK